MLADKSLKTYSDESCSKFTDHAVENPFNTEMENLLNNLRKKANDPETIEKGGHPNHPLGKHPTLHMMIQYQTARCRALKSMKTNRCYFNLIKYNRQIVYPPFRFLLYRFIIRVFFILKKHRKASYPNVRLTEYAYLYTPIQLGKRIHYFIAYIKFFVHTKLHLKL